MLNRDGGSHVARWRNRDGEIEAFIDSDDQNRVVARDFVDLADRIVAFVDESLHAGEWVLDWDPPLPCPDSRIATPTTHVIATPNTGYRVADHASDMWTGGFCPECNHPRGERTTAPLRIEEIDEDDSLLMPNTMFGRLPQTPIIYNERAVEVMRESLDEQCDWRRVEIKGETAYFEALPRRTWQECAFKGIEGIGGYWCHMCGHQQFSYQLPEPVSFSTLLPASGMPPRDQGRCTSGGHLVLPIGVWRQIRDGRNAFGALSRGVYILDDSLIDPDPRPLLRDGFNGTYKESP